MKLKRLTALLLSMVLLASGCGESDNSPEYTVLGTDGSINETLMEGLEGNDEESSDIADPNFKEAFEEEGLWEEYPAENEFSTEMVENVENNSENSGSAADNSENTGEISDNSQPTEAAEVSTITITSFTTPADVSKRAKSITSNMSDEQKAAQLILARCPAENAVSLMEQYQFGGYTLYAVDFENRDFDTAKQFISDIRAASEVEPIIAVDEEGGTVVRASKYYRSEPFASMQDIFAAGGLEAITADSREKAEFLTSLGINMNLAPVADIAEEGDYIYNRTTGTDTDTACTIVREIIDVSGEYDLMSCLKHFPGYGSNVDTHTGIAVDNRSEDIFRSNDFLPFIAGLESSYTPAVLINHNIVTCFDDTLPSSLSAPVHKLLRNELGFGGVIITDDLGMEGIKAYTGSLSPYVVGIFAGNDMLCVSDPITAYNDILNAVNDGTISQKMLDEHVQRIIQMKLDYKVLS